MSNIAAHPQSSVPLAHAPAQSNQTQTHQLYKGYDIPEGIKCDHMGYEAYGPCVFEEHLPTRIMKAFSHLEYPYSITKTNVVGGVVSISIRRHKDRIVSFRVPASVKNPHLQDLLKAVPLHPLIVGKPQGKKMPKNTLRFWFSPAVLDAYGCGDYLRQGFMTAFPLAVLENLKVYRYDVAYDLKIAPACALVHRPYCRKVNLISKNGNIPTVYMSAGRTSRHFLYYDKVQQMEQVKSMWIDHAVLTRFEFREKLTKHLTPAATMDVPNPFANIRVFVTQQALGLMEDSPQVQTLAGYVKSNGPETFSPIVNKKLTAYQRKKLFELLEESKLSGWKPEEFSTAWKTALVKNPVVSYFMAAYPAG